MLLLSQEGGTLRQQQPTSYLNSPLIPPANVAAKLLLNDFSANYGGMYFNIEDRGTCVNVKRATVWYNICPETNYGEAIFPRTLSPANHSITIEGRCSGTSATDINGIKPIAKCTSDGFWIDYSNHCPCEPGKDRRSIEPGLTPACYGKSHYDINKFKKK